METGHIVCVDEIGVVDPANGAPDHIDISQYVLDRRAQGVIFHEQFLAVERQERMPTSWRRQAMMLVRRFLATDLFRSWRVMLRCLRRFGSSITFARRSRSPDFSQGRCLSDVTASCHTVKSDPDCRGGRVLDFHFIPQFVVGFRDFSQTGLSKCDSATAKADLKRAMENSPRGKVLGLAIITVSSTSDTSDK